MSDDIPGGGVILLQESFDDANFASRGWYDAPSGEISREHAPGSTASFVCNLSPGGTHCSGGAPARHKLAPTETIYLGFWLKFSADWIGSGKGYHPHMLHFLTDADGDYVGYANTHLTTYTEVVWDGAAGTGRALLGLQDSLNVDKSCVLLNNDSIVGCNGDFASYSFSENRSACSCNGLVGDVDVRDCYSWGGSNYYSFRGWKAQGAFTDAAGPNAKTDWHFVEVYFQMNSVSNGVGIPDGKIRWVQDGVTLIKSDSILMRTGAQPALRFVQQGFVGGYIGDGSPIAQAFWIDEMTVATARP